MLFIAHRRAAPPAVVDDVAEEIATPSESIGTDPQPLDNEAVREEVSAALSSPDTKEPVVYDDDDFESEVKTESDRNVDKYAPISGLNLLLHHAFTYLFQIKYQSLSSQLIFLTWPMM